MVHASLWAGGMRGVSSPRPVNPGTIYRDGSPIVRFSRMAGIASHAPLALVDVEEGRRVAREADEGDHLAPGEEPPSLANKRSS